MHIPAFNALNGHGIVTKHIINGHQRHRDKAVLEALQL